MRRAYRVLLPALVRRTIAAPRNLPFSVVSFSSQRDLPEQVASLRSFLRNAGEPVDFTVISDGSHAPASRRLLRLLHPCVRVVDWTAVVRPDLPRPVTGYAAVSPMGKKLAVELSLPVARPTMYVDADVLFFPGAAALAGLQPGGHGWFLADCGAGYLDEGLLAGDEPAEPVNAGFFLLDRQLDWSTALDRLARLGGVPGFHTEQTLVHLAMHASGARPLDPRRFVLAVDDMFSYRDVHAGRSIVLRHYTTPVRYKFWCSLPRALR